MYNHMLKPAEIEVILQKERRCNVDLQQDLHIFK